MFMADANDVQESEAMIQVIYRLSDLAQKNVGDGHWPRSDLMAHRFERLKRPVIPSVRNFFDEFVRMPPKLEERFYRKSFKSLSEADKGILRARAERAMATVTAGDLAPTRIHSRAIFGESYDNVRNHFI
jgi:hypothetical protein